MVVLDRSLREVQRLPAPRSPVALAVDKDTVLVAGELAANVARFRWNGERLEPAGTAVIDGVRAIRGITFGPGRWVYLIEEQRGRLIAFELDGSARDRLVFGHRRDVTVGKGPIRMARAGDRLIIDCLLDHALVIQRLEPSGMPTGEAPIRIVLDGPIWSFAASDGGGGLRIAIGAAEDHPLDRTIGAFGYVDSFLYLYDVDLDARRATRIAAVNLGEHGVVVPKVLLLSGATVRVSGYGSDKLLQLSLRRRSRSARARGRERHRFRSRDQRRRRALRRRAGLRGSAARRVGRGGPPGRHSRRSSRSPRPRPAIPCCVSARR